MNGASGRFAAIENLRIRERDAAAGELARVNEAVATIQIQIDDLDAQIASPISGDGRVGAINVDRLLTQGRYAIQLMADRQALLQTMAQLEQEYQRRQSRLAEAQIEVKRFERLRSKQQALERAAEIKREHMATDEATMRMQFGGR